MIASDNLEHRVVISGIGRSQVGRRLNRDSLDLTVDACLAAIADAGLTPAEIDGLETWPGESRGAGFGGPGIMTLQDVLRLRLNWYLCGSEGTNVLGFIIDGCMAVATGLARHVLAFRTLTEATAQGARHRPGIRSETGRADAWLQWTLPYGACSAVHLAALHAQRHFDTYGTTPEQLGAIAVSQRRYAGLNPDAIYRKPMTLDDYLAARMVSTPLRLFDCDVPADGATAFVLSPVEYARDAPAPAIGFEAMGASRRGRALWEQRDDMTTMTGHDAAATMWSRTDLTPGDVDVAQLYDGFSVFTLLWLEAFGFCGRGESGPFVEGGQRISLEGEIPVNTNGGQLSAGRFVGAGQLYESCLQLRGLAGDRQVSNAEVALIGAGGGNIAQALLLSRWGA